MNPIQARLASEDTKNWKAGTLIAVNEIELELEVEFRSGVIWKYRSKSASVFARIVPAPIFVNERFRVLAMASVDGNVIGTQVDQPGGSIFDLAGKSRLQFIRIVLPDEAW